MDQVASLKSDCMPLSRDRNCVCNHTPKLLLRKSLFDCIFLRISACFCWSAIAQPPKARATLVSRTVKDGSGQLNGYAVIAPGLHAPVSTSEGERIS